MRAKPGTSNEAPAMAIATTGTPGTRLETQPALHVKIEKRPETKLLQLFSHISPRTAPDLHNQASDNKNTTARSYLNVGADSSRSRSKSPTKASGAPISGAPKSRSQTGAHTCTWGMTKLVPRRSEV